MADRNRRRDRQAFALARDYLLSLDPRITPKLLERYFVPDKRPKTLSHIYQRALESAQNANMKSGVIKGGIGEVKALRPVLCGFNPRAVFRKFKGWRHLLREIVVKLKPKGKIRRRPNSIWPQYCQTALSAAAFFARFNTANDFYAWADLFDCDGRARPALPLILQGNIKGVGFALACDFVKELGYVNYGKPDVQLTKTLMALGLSADDGPYAVFHDIVRVARNNRVTPYHADKLFWLIGSGDFYRDGFRTGGHRDQFIKYARRELRR